MKAKEILAEAPPQIVDPTDFGLTDDAANREFAAKLLRRSKEVIEDHPAYMLFRTGDLINGYIAMYLKADKILGYLIRYRAEKRALIGGTVTQVVLWRRSATPHVPGITRHVFFDVLLTRWPAVMSDAEQTPDGAEFWGNRLAEASIGPYEVGLVDFGRNQVEWWDRQTPFSSWLMVTKSRAWGRDQRFQNLRYIIKRT